MRQRGGKWLVVVDGVEGKKYDAVVAGSSVFSPDSKRVAYGAERGGKWWSSWMAWKERNMT